jgi:hypothetical protein
MPLIIRAFIIHMYSAIELTDSEINVNISKETPKIGFKFNLRKLKCVQIMCQPVQQLLIKMKFINNTQSIYE